MHSRDLSERIQLDVCSRLASVPPAELFGYIVYTFVMPISFIWFVPSWCVITACAQSGRCHRVQCACARPFPRDFKPEGTVCPGRESRLLQRVTPTHIQFAQFCKPWRLFPRWYKKLPYARETNHRSIRGIACNSCLLPSSASVSLVIPFKGIENS